MQFNIGDKVLCIDDNFDYGQSSAITLKILMQVREYPVFMNLYTVLKYDSITKSIVLAEVKNAQVLNLSSRSMEDVQWNAWRFIHVKKVSPSKSKPLKTKALQLDVFENENVLIRAVIL